MADYGIAFDFLDVGMGDGTLIQLPPAGSGLLWLADFGEKGSPFKIPIANATAFLVQRITEVCKKRLLSAPQVDYLSISHADGDHWNKLDWIIQGKISEEKKGLWEKAGWPKDTTLNIETLIFGGDWEEDYEKRNKPLANIVWKASNKTITLGNCDRDPKDDEDFVQPRISHQDKHDSDLNYNIYLLSSNQPKKSGKDCNPKSLVWMFEYKTYKVIIAGDAESKVVEPAIIKYYPEDFLRSFALKLGHHGSNASTSPEWAAAVQPSVIFSSGDRRWGHPYCEPIKRCAPYVKAAADKRWFACSASGRENDYENHNTYKANCPNLWYVVTEDSVTLKGSNGKSHTVKKGLYTGVQYSLQINPRKTPFLSTTDQWPAPNQ